VLITTPLDSDSDADSESDSHADADSDSDAHADSDSDPDSNSDEVRGVWNERDGTAECGCQGRCGSCAPASWQVAKIKPAE
jgi:hypothetical protein